MWVEIILFFLATYSLTFGLIESKLIEKPRNKIKKKHHLLNYVFGCYHCLGFWSSIIVYILLFKDISIDNVIIFALAGSGMNLVIYNIIATLVKVRTYLEKHIKRR